jgi:hypothetical protein
VRTVFRRQYGKCVKRHRRFHRPRSWRSDRLPSVPYPGCSAGCPDRDVEPFAIALRRSFLCRRRLRSVIQAAALRHRLVFACDQAPPKQFDIGRGPLPISPCSCHAPIGLCIITCLSFETQLTVYKRQYLWAWNAQFISNYHRCLIGFRYGIPHKKTLLNRFEVGRGLPCTGSDLTGRVTLPMFPAACGGRAPAERAKGPLNH